MTEQLMKVNIIIVQGFKYNQDTSEDVDLKFRRSTRSLDTFNKKKMARQKDMIDKDYR